MKYVFLIPLVLVLCGCSSKSKDNENVRIQSNFDNTVEIEYKVKYEEELFLFGSTRDFHKTKNITVNVFHAITQEMDPGKPVKVKYNGITVEYSVDNNKVLIVVDDFMSGPG